jgi:hypothetical protein
MSSENRLVNELLGPLQMHFLAAEQAYADYLAHSQNFLFASSLKRINSAVRQLLLDRGHLLPEGHRGDALALIRHYDVWLTLWDDHHRRTRPRVDEPFIFQNDVAFPKSAQSKLMNLLEEMRLGSARNGPTPLSHL